MADSKKGVSVPATAIIGQKVEEGRPLTNEELKVAFEGPAVSANRCLLVMGASGVRIAFVEQSPEQDVYFRSAVVLPVQQAISLRDTLSRVLADVEPQIMAAEEAAKAAAKDDG